MLMESPFYATKLFLVCEERTNVFNATDIRSHSKECLVGGSFGPESRIEPHAKRRKNRNCYV